MLERLTPLFMTICKALREDTSSRNSHWDAMLDRPREMATDSSDDVALPESVTLIVGAPVYFPGSLEEGHAKP